MPNPIPKYKIENSTYITGSPALPTSTKPFNNFSLFLSFSAMNLAPSGEILTEDLATNVDASIVGS